jgi:hypothetical protein
MMDRMPELAPEYPPILVAAEASRSIFAVDTRTPLTSHLIRYADIRASYLERI